MRKFSAVWPIVFLLCVYGTAVAGDADSAATQANLDQVDRTNLDLADSTQPAIGDTLAPGIMAEGGILDRLILPILVTAAVGGLLILLFTQRG
jgi:hypothetical protein